MSLAASSVSVHFGGVAALVEVDVEVEPGRIRGLIGPNGSGKSTLFNCLTGLVKIRTGSVALDGRDVTRLPSHRRVALGLARTFQTPRFDPQVTVRDSISCGFHQGATRSLLDSLTWSPRVRRAERSVDNGVTELLERFELTDVAELRIGALPLGKVRLVEVARAMAESPRYLLLDEPAAGLADDERELLGGQIRTLAAAGVGILLVEHDYHMVLDLCEEILVLANGRTLSRGTPAQVANDPNVLRSYLGVVTESAVESGR